MIKGQAPLITALRSKIHRAMITSVEVHYEGSCLIDEVLLYAANIHEYEQVHIYNVNNGERFITYAISSKIRGEIQLNGAAALKGSVGDRIIICTYHLLTPLDAQVLTPTKVFLEEGRNHITDVKTRR